MEFKPSFNCRCRLQSYYTPFHNSSLYTVINYRGPTSGFGCSALKLCSKILWIYRVTSFNNFYNAYNKHTAMSIRDDSRFSVHWQQLKRSQFFGVSIDAKFQPFGKADFFMFKLYVICFYRPDIITSRFWVNNAQPFFCTCNWFCWLFDVWDVKVHVLAYVLLGFLANCVDSVRIAFLFCKQWSVNILLQTSVNG